MLKTLTNMLVDLRLDLKDSGTLWSNAELTRCINRAVADLSRFLPLEKVYETTFDTDEVSDESITSPTAASATRFVNAADISATVAGGTLTLANRTNDIPRPVALAITDANASITAFVIIVKGIDENYKYIEESFFLSGGLSQTGKMLFRRVDEVEVDAITGNGAADTCSVGTATHNGVWVQLANKPIHYHSEKVTNSAGTTTYKRETDYIVDYKNGRVSLVSGGAMAANTAYLVDYTRSKLCVDLSNLTDFIRVERVEYPVGNVPQNFPGYGIWGRVLTIEGDIESQAEVSDAEHATVLYFAEHQPPTASAPGSYPAFLEHTVEHAANSYALFIKAIQFEHQAVTDLASLRTALTNIGAVHTSFGTAIGKVATYLDNNTNEDSKYWLTKITTDIANLRTSIETAVDAVATNLGLVFTTSLDKATTGAEAYLDTGDDKIPTLNIGANEPENYAAYSKTRADIASIRVSASLAYLQEAEIRLGNLKTYIEQASGWQGVADEFRLQAEQYVAEMDRYLQEANQYSGAIDDDIAVANMFRTEAVEKRNEVWSIWRDKSQYIGDSSSASVSQMPG